MWSCFFSDYVKILLPIAICSVVLRNSNWRFFLGGGAHSTPPFPQTLFINSIFFLHSDNIFFSRRSLRHGQCLAASSAALLPFMKFPFLCAWHLIIATCLGSSNANINYTIWSKWGTHLAWVYPYCLARSKFQSARQSGGYGMFLLQEFVKMWYPIIERGGTERWWPVLCDRRKLVVCSYGSNMAAAEAKLSFDLAVGARSHPNS